MLLVAIAKEAQRSLQDFGLQDLADMFWALAQLGGVQPTDVEECLDLMADAVVSLMQQTSQVAPFKG